MKNQRRKKVFCIGFNKTGTTSLGFALSILGVQVGDQTEGESLIEDWARRDFRRLIDYCRSADAFQDVPFSLPYTYAVLDHAFPGSKFILTERRNGDEWFDSLTRFHTKLFDNGRLPNKADMLAFGYHAPGWFWRAHQLAFNVDESNLYDRAHYVAQYECHSRQVRDYFLHRTGDLLILNVANPNAMNDLCEFVGASCDGRAMPHLNSSRHAA